MKKIFKEIFTWETLLSFTLMAIVWSAIGLPNGLCGYLAHTIQGWVVIYITVNSISDWFDRQIERYKSRKFYEQLKSLKPGETLKYKDQVWSVKERDGETIIDCVFNDD